MKKTTVKLCGKKLNKLDPGYKKPKKETEVKNGLQK